jgi:hypothetical protein
MAANVPAHRHRRLSAHTAAQARRDHFALAQTRLQQGQADEDAHVAEAKDSPGVIREAANRDMMQMLIDGELDAAIYGAELPKDPRLQI